MEKSAEDHEQIEKKTTTPEPVNIESGTEVPLSVANGTDRYPDVYQEHTPDKIVKAIRKGNRFTFTCENTVTLKITVLESGLFQLTYSYDGFFHPEFSYALDPEFKPAAISPAFFEQADHYMIRTKKMICLIQKENLSIKFTDLDGRVINEDADGFYTKTTILKGVDRVKITKKAISDERFLGFGDKTKPNDLRGHRFVNWNSDAFS